MLFSKIRKGHYDRMRKFWYNRLLKKAGKITGDLARHEQITMPEGISIISTGARNLRSMRIKDSIDLARRTMENPADNARILTESLAKVEAPEVRKAAEAARKYSQYDTLVEGEKTYQTARLLNRTNEATESEEEIEPVIAPGVTPAAPAVPVAPIVSSTPITPVVPVAPVVLDADDQGHHAIEGAVAPLVGTEIDMRAPVQTMPAGVTLEDIWNLVYNLGLQLTGIVTRLDAVETRLNMNQNIESVPVVENSEIDQAVENDEIDPEIGNIRDEVSHIGTAINDITNTLGQILDPVNPIVAEEVVAEEEVAEEEVAEEVVAEEEVAEEVVAEVVAEEAVAEVVAEVVAEEAVAEDVAEEVVAEDAVAEVVAEEEVAEEVAEEEVVNPEVAKLNELKDIVIHNGLMIDDYYDKKGIQNLTPDEKNNLYTDSVNPSNPIQPTDPVITK